MKVGRFPQHQNKTSDTDRYKEYFFIARGSQVIVNAIRIFERWCEFSDAKGLVVHVVSSSFNVSSFEKKESNAAMRLRVANNIALNQVFVYHESVCGQCPMQNQVSEILLPSTSLQIVCQHYSKKCDPNLH